MNILTDTLPDHITVCKKNYPIRTDFRTWIRFDSIVNNHKISIFNKLSKILELCFDPNKCPVLPPSLNDTLSALYEFYICGAEKNKGKKGTDNARVFSFEEDSEYVYAAFYEQYGIDLAQSNMHWWHFSALFKGLEPDVRLMKIIAYRSVDTVAISDSKKQSFYRKMKDIYALPDNRTEEEKEKDLAETLCRLF